MCRNHAKSFGCFTSRTWTHPVLFVVLGFAICLSRRRQSRIPWGCGRLYVTISWYTHPLTNTWVVKRLPKWWRYGIVEQCRLLFIVRYFRIFIVWETRGHGKYDIYLSCPNFAHNKYEIYSVHAVPTYFFSDFNT